MGRIRSLVVRTGAAALFAASLNLLLCSVAYSVQPQISAGARHALAVRSNGTLWAWGHNASAQLGDGTTTPRTMPVYVGAGFVTVAAGNSSSFALKADGTLWAWGANADGQLGDGTSVQRYVPASIGGGYSAVAAGQAHTLALKSDGSVWSWGSNTYGQLGDGGTTTRNTPQQIGTGYRGIAAAGARSYAVKSDGSLWAWGNNTDGLLGDGTTTHRASPVQIGSGYASLVAGPSHMFAFKTDASLWAWGSNLAGQLGDGTTIRRMAPVQISGNYVAVAAGDDAYSIAVKGDGSMMSWGYNASGQLGNGTTGYVEWTPLQIGSGFAAVSASSGGFTLALGTDESIWSWGWNNYGTLGDGTTADRLNPAKVSQDWNSVPIAPTGVGANGANATLVISWNPVAGASAYKVYLSYSPGVTKSNRQNAYSATTSPFSGTSVYAGVTVYYVVTAITPQGESAESAEGMVTIAGAPPPPGPSFNLASGWNLAGNGSAGAFDVASVFADAGKVLTVWKWVPAKNSWAFYTPTLVDRGAAYAASKGYEYLASINPGEGFWVNAAAAHSVRLPVADANPPPGMGSGWNLVAIGSRPTPAGFNGMLNYELTSLWAWDAARLNWYFYAPSLEKNGTLASYVASKSYLDFGAATLDPSVGFWVSMPTPPSCNCIIIQAK